LHLLHGKNVVVVDFLAKTQSALMERGVYLSDSDSIIGVSTIYTVEIGAKNVWHFSNSLISNGCHRSKVIPVGIVRPASTFFLLFSNVRQEPDAKT